MRILLDESLPRTLRPALTGHFVKTVAEMGWAALGNGELLRRAAGDFDVLLTADQNLRYQQNLRALPMAVVALAAASNRIEHLTPLVPKLLGALAALEPRSFQRIES